MKLFILLFLTCACGNSVNDKKPEDGLDNASNKYRCITQEKQ